MKVIKVLSIIFGIGLLLFIVSAIALGGFSKIFKNQPKFNEIVVEENEVKSIELNIMSDEVEFRPSTDGKLKIDYYDFEEPIYKYSFEDGKATLKSHLNWKNWFNNMFSFNPDKLPMIVYYPESVTETVKINLSSGSVEIKEVQLNVKYLDIQLSSGNFKVDNAKAEEMDIDVSSGNIVVSNTVSDTTSIHLSSGTINLEDCQLGETTTRVSSGDIRGVVDFSSLNVKVSSGAVTLNLKGSQADYLVDASLSSGIVSLYNGDGKEIVSSHDSIYFGSGSKKADISVSSGMVKLSFAK